MSLQGRVALVTGAGSGIGRAVSLLLAQVIAQASRSLDCTPEQTGTHGLVGFPEARVGPQRRHE